MDRRQGGCPAAPEHHISGRKPKVLVWEDVKLDYGFFALGPQGGEGRQVRHEASVMIELDAI